MEELIKNTFGKANKTDYKMAVQNTINFNVLKHLMNLSASNKSIPQVKAFANASLHDLKRDLNKMNTNITKEMIYRIDQFMEEPEKFEVIPSPSIPDGSPIGSFQCLNN